MLITLFSNYNDVFQYFDYLHFSSAFENNWHKYFEGSSWKNSMIEKEKQTKKETTAPRNSK